MRRSEVDDTAGETVVRSDSGETGDAEAETAAVAEVATPRYPEKEEEAKAAPGNDGAGADTDVERCG